MRAALILVALLIAPAPLAAADQTPITGPSPMPVATPMPDDAIDLGNDAPGRLSVPVNIGGNGPYHFTIDTGAERTVISRELATRLGLQAGPRRTITAMTGAAQVNTVLIPSINVSSVGGTQIEAPVLAAVDLGAPGLLGIDTLRDHAVILDFDTNQMTVRPSFKRSSRFKPEPGEIIVRARSLLGQLIVSDARYRGHRVRVVLDTGSVVSIGNNALRRRVGNHAVPREAISLTSVTGDTMQADYALIGDVGVGTVIFRNLPIAFADAPPFKRFGLGEQPAILLGMDALSQFRRIEIDFANHEVRFTLPRDPGAG
ncbi:MAG: aspartyl protease family protein [Sphingomonas sp.]|jgi:predicted aspartyl protease